MLAGAVFRRTACIETDDEADTSATDHVTPWPGEVSCYLVRAGNLCGKGSAGEDSGGAPRIARDCP
jgi:hypothetical protein